MKKKLIESSPVGRRTFMKAAGLTAAGFALSVQPVSAETIYTPATGLITGDEWVKRGDDRIPVYVARPSGSGPYPAIVVIHEIFGQHEHIRDVARRFAHEGYIAVAPELYEREGGVQHLKDIQAVLTVVKKVPDRQFLDDLGAVVGHIQAMPQHNGKIGATGFCWGGRATWLFCADNPAVNAAVAWYGHVDQFGSPPNQSQRAIDMAAGMNGPVLGLYGGQDRGITAEHLAEMEKALSAARKTYEIVVYPQAPHAFYADYRPSYRETEAENGWSRCLRWLSTYME